MRKSRLIFILLWTITFNSYGQDYNITLGNLQSLRNVYENIGNYAKALELSDSIVNLCKQNDPKKAAYQQFKESQLYIEKKDFPNAINSYKKALLFYDTYGNDAKELSENEIVNDLLDIYISYNMYDSAFVYVKENQQRLDKLEHYVDDIQWNHTKDLTRDMVRQIGKTKKNLYWIYDHYEHHLQAASAALKAVHYIQLAEVVTTEDEATWWNNAAYSVLQESEVNYNPTDLLSNAEWLLNTAKTKWEELPNRHNNTNYITFLGNYGKFFTCKKDIERARTYYREMYDLADKRNNGDLMLSAIEELAGTYKGEKALEVYKESLEVYEDVKDTLNMARLCHLISKEYWMTLEKEEQAEQYANKALELLTQANVKNVTTCNILENLARLYYHIGLGDRAVETYEMALDIKEEKDINCSHAEFVEYYEFKVELMRQLYLRYPNEHIEEMSKLERICNTILKENLDNKILEKRVRTLLSKLYMYSRRFDDAEEQFQKLFSIEEELWGKNSYNYIVTLQDFAICNALKGDIKASRDLYIECVKYYPTLGDYNNILTKSMMLKDSVMTEKWLPLTFDFSLDYLKKTLSYMGSWQREDLYRFGSNIEIMMTPAFLYPQNESFAQYAYNAAIISKGLLLSMERNIGSSIRMASDSILMTKHKEVSQIQEQIQQSKDSAEFISLNHKLEIKEKELLSLLKKKGCFTRDLDLTWLDVQKELGDNDIAIEFVISDSIVTIGTGDNSTAYYGALLIRKDWSAPKVVRLSQMTETDSLIREIITTFDDEIDYSNDEWSEISSKLYTKIWEPIIQYIKPGDRILYSPINMLSIMPWEACVIHDREYMNELYDMVRLSATKYICNSTTSHDIDQAVLYGGLIYDSTSTAIPPKDASPSKRAGWQYLSDTADEVKNIAEIFKEKNIPTTIYSKKEGTEESFKSLSGKNIPLLHIATHGFYFNDQESKTLDFLNDINAPFKRGMDTSVLLRSGLMLSNGQKAWLEGHTSLNEEDGILLASEISLLDLHNVDLVTLSACQTGLGEIRSDGVYGLQRAFKKAGVNSMLMTLWTVESESAQILMTQFYKNLLSGQSKRQALLSAQKYLQEYDNGRYNSPRYWAAFIMLDGLK